VESALLTATQQEEYYMSAPNLVIDPSLRDWVLFPIFGVMVLIGLIRHYGTVLLQPKPKVGDLMSIREQ
jgi:hypothetical protein